MLFRCLVILFCLTTTFAQKGGRQGSATEDNPSVRSPSRILSNRKIPQPSEPIQQVQEPEDRDSDEDREIVQAVRPRRPPAPRPQQPVEEEEGHEPAPEPYSFSYSVDDPETGAASSREETQDANGEIVGYYHLKDADGRSRRVDYTAGKDGFKATIKSNEEGLNARAPADVNIELSASPSETRPSYALNNRPAPTETSIKSFGRPTQGRFFDRLIPALPSPIPPPIPQQIEQKQEPLEAQITQTYESNDPSESLEIVQQKNIDEELPVESTPIKAPPQPPIQRPLGRFTPQRIQTYRENTLASLEPVITPIVQIKEEVSNSIQDSQQTEESLPPLLPSPPKGLLQQSYTQFRPLSSILGTASIPWSQRLVQYQQTPVAVQQSVPNLAPLSPPSNNIVTQQREPIVQERLFNYLNPLPSNPVIQSPQYIVASPQPQPLVYSSINRLDNTYVRPQLINTGYRLNIQHNTAPIPQPIPQQTSQEVLIQEKVDDLPPEPIQQRQPLFEPQVYEPISQTYEPLQQEAEDPAEESRAPPPSSNPHCECAQQTESIVQSVKGSPSEPAPVKIGRLSPFHEFIPQAFRTR